MCARIFFNGDGRGKDTHISLFVVVLRGKYDDQLHWPFQQKVTLTIVDQQGKDDVVDVFQPSTTSVSFQKPKNNMNIANGSPLFMPLTYLKLKGRSYVKDDCMLIKVKVDDLNVQDQDQEPFGEEASA